MSANALAGPAGSNPSPVVSLAASILNGAAPDYEEYDLASFALGAAVCGAWRSHRHDDLTDLLTKDVPAHLLNPTTWFWRTDAGIMQRGFLATLIVLWRAVGVVEDLGHNAFDDVLVRMWEHMNNKRGPSSLLTFDEFLAFEELAGFTGTSDE